LRLARPSSAGALLLAGREVTGECWCSIEANQGNTRTSCCYKVMSCSKVPSLVRHLGTYGVLSGMSAALPPLALLGFMDVPLVMGSYAGLRPVVVCSD
jgi:hypothetical protein